MLIFNIFQKIQNRKTLEYRQAFHEKSFRPLKIHRFTFVERMQTKIIRSFDSRSVKKYICYKKKNINLDLNDNESLLKIIVK